MTLETAWRVARYSLLVLGVALFAQSLRRLGLSDMVEGMSRVGWGFAAILLLSGAREAARTLAWLRAVEGPVQLPFLPAVRARLAGEALSTLLPMGILVGEPAKAAHVKRRLPLSSALNALAVEFAFYSGSVVLLFGAGAIALAAAHQVPRGVATVSLVAVSAMVLGIMKQSANPRPAPPQSATLQSAIAAQDSPSEAPPPEWSAERGVSGNERDASRTGASSPDASARRVVRRMTEAVEGVGRLTRLVWGFASRHPERLWPIAGFEVLFHALAVAEVYVTLMLISPNRPTVAAAVVLETVNRAITMIFKMLPLRVGVDEASASLFTGRLDLGAATGVTLALARKLRMLVWSAVGLVCLIQRTHDLSNRSPQEAAMGTLETTMTKLTKLTAMVLVGLALVGSPSSASAQTPAPSVAGSVSAVGPDGQPFVVPGVVLTLRCAGSDARTDVSDDKGDFQFADVPTGSCSIIAELQGFKSETKTISVRSGETAGVQLQLGLDTLHEEVTVNAVSPIEDNPIAAHVERMTGAVMQTAPLANERFQDALPLIPGVVRGPDGLLNIGGARSNQSALMFNSADGTDPVTGEDAIELPIDAVSSVQVRGTAYAPEFGQSVGAVTTVETQQAGEAWHFQVNDLEPRPRRRGGKFVGIESFTPRFTVAGPISSNVSVLESVQYEYTKNRVYSLPPFESDTQVESIESFSRVDWTAGPASHLTFSAMVSPRKTTYAGLNTFNPQSVTPNIRNHNVLGSATEQMVAGGSGVFETRVSVKQFDSTIYPSQGHGPMVLAPDINSGSYFNDQDRTSRRFEWRNTYSFTPIGPSHLVKLGAGVTYETFDGINISRPVDIVRENGTLAEEITFTGDGRLSRDRTSLQGYAQDAWSVGSRLTLQYGARFDRDSITGDINAAPRGSFTATLTPSGRTVARGGVGLFYDPITLNVASFDQMQERTVTAFPIGVPVHMQNVVPLAIHTPRSVVWNLEIDREWIKNLFVRVGYQQRDNRFESVVDPVVLASGEQWLELRTDGRSRYREGQITARYQFHATDQIVGSYTRSSASGSLNDFNSFFGNIENPVIRPNEDGPLAWDAPNRFLFWSTVSLPRDFTVFPLVDVRTGFPVSVMDEARYFVGPRNEAGRFPTFVSLDLQVSKRLRVFGHRATIGVKMFNITNHYNPRDFQGNLAAVNFGGFANGVGRTLRGKWVFEF